MFDENVIKYHEHKFEKLKSILEKLNECKTLIYSVNLHSENISNAIEKLQKELEITQSTLRLLNSKNV